MIIRTIQSCLCASTLLAVGAVVHAECPALDFEGVPVGTDVSAFYPGVTFSAAPATCGSVRPIIVLPSNGTSSGVRALGLETGCSGISGDFIRMTFAEEQDSVSFNVGGQFEAGLDFFAQAFNAGGTQIWSQTFETGVGTTTAVNVDPAGGGIARVEVSSLIIGFFETIDDLRFGSDSTPPEVDITSPAFDTCVCGDDLVTIFGSVDDSDGEYACDSMAYLPVNAAPGTPWTVAGNACGAFTGPLHTLNTGPLAEGRYYVRILGSNECGLSGSDVTVIRVDRSFGTVAISGVDGGRADGSLCGMVEVKGTISDGCGGISWSLLLAPAGTSNFTEIAFGTGGRDCLITPWNTSFAADGSYTMRLTATDGCGHSDSSDFPVFIDNSADFCACSPDINQDGVVDALDFLLIIAHWGPFGG